MFFLPRDDGEAEQDREADQVGSRKPFAEPRPASGTLVITAETTDTSLPRMAIAIAALLNKTC
jgi:hypothetical protein